MYNTCTFENVTSRLQTTSLVLNNRAKNFAFLYVTESSEAQTTAVRVLVIQSQRWMIIVSSQLTDLAREWGLRYSSSAVQLFEVALA